MEDVPQPGSLEADGGVFCSAFDMTGTRLVTGGADIIIKINFPCCVIAVLFASVDGLFCDRSMWSKWGEVRIM
jgi:hypothetical protein